MAKKNHAVHFSTVAKVLIVSLFLGGAGVGYVVQKDKIRKLSQTVKSNDIELKELKHKFDQEKADLARVTKGTEIRRQLELQSSTLQEVDPRLVIRLPEPPIEEASMQGRIAQQD